MSDLFIVLLALLLAVLVLSIILRVVFKRPLKDIVLDWLNQLF
jgi:hypothetical protein